MYTTNNDTHTWPKHNIQKFLNITRITNLHWTLKGPGLKLSEIQTEPPNIITTHLAILQFNKMHHSILLHYLEDLPSEKQLQISSRQAPFAENPSVQCHIFKIREWFNMDEVSKVLD